MNNQEKNTYVRNQILTTLLEMMKTESFNSITISDLVAKAEVGRASFYRNYRTKEDVLREEAKRNGYNINKMTVAGGSAGHTLAMIYAYRDADEAPVPVVFTFGAVGPSSFYVEDWGIFGLGVDNDESRTAGAGLFSVMSGSEITPNEIADGSYASKMKAISAADWVCENPIPTVVAYGACDHVQPFEASKRLEAALKENNVDYKYYVLPHSGHGLQNDNKISRQWMETVEEYLDRYMGTN